MSRWWGAYILARALAASGDDYEKGFANYQKGFADYVKRNQWLVVDNVPGGAPIPQEVFERIVNSLDLKTY